MVFEHVSPTLMPSIRDQYVTLLYRVNDIRECYMQLQQDKKNQIRKYIILHVNPREAVLWAT